MISINAQILEDIYKSDKANIDSIIVNKKTELKSFIDNPTRIVSRKPVNITLTVEQENYLNYLYNNFEDIVLANTLSLQSFVVNFNNIIESNLIKTTPFKEFRNELINRLGYKELRDSFYPDYFEKIGIKSCVYCNSQLALTVRNVDGEKNAKFQVDHYYPKSEYPCFSISFYNLYPVCGPCNNSKSSNSVIFNLYSNNFIDYTSSNFKFSLDKKSLLKYRINGINSELKIVFTEPHNANFNNTFAINGIYDTQKDIAEELVLKSMIYNKAYTDSLKNGLTKLYKKKAPMLERLIIGNYTDERDIHKRPMSKFVQDIARQLKLI